MERIFAVTRTWSAGWNDGLAMEEQEDWKGHAAFMNALHAAGFVLIGGPLEGTPDVLLIVRANDPDEIASRLSADPWTRMDVLRIKQALPWNLRLGSAG
jgi:uncharacterized protein YciI